MQDPRELLLNLLETGDQKAFTAPITNNNAANATTRAMVLAHDCVYFPTTGKFSCAICFSTFDTAKNKLDAAMLVSRAHHDKCISLNKDQDCLVCRVRLNAESRMEHFLSKIHSEKMKLIDAKLKANERQAFYYTDKGSGQTKPFDNSQFSTMDWADKEKTMDAFNEHRYNNRQVYGYKIAKSIASCKNGTVAHLAYGSDAVSLLETLGFFATIGVLPCRICMPSEETDVLAILGAVKDGVPADKAQKFFETKQNTKAVCQLCKKSLDMFCDPAVVAATCKSMKALITKATPNPR